jgi:hypothetical protein
MPTTPEHVHEGNIALLNGTARLYYEAHITVEPLDERMPLYATFVELCRRYDFRPAEFLLVKPFGNPPDAFASARSTDLAALVQRVRSLGKALVAANIEVWRYKVEDTLFDSRKDGDQLDVGFVEPLGTTR